MADDAYAELHDADPATQAFDQMRGEMALVRRAVEKLAAERADIIIPDYSPTLDEIAGRLAATVQGMKTLAARPAMQITPQEMAGRINAAAEMARRSDHVAVAKAQSRFDRASHDLRAIARTARTTNEQRKTLYFAATAGVIAGMMLWAIIPGAVARSAPRSWAWPERMAAHILRTDVWPAGERMLARADPERWQQVLFANRIVQENSETIANCLNETKNPATPKRCSIMIMPAERHGRLRP